MRIDVAAIRPDEKEDLLKQAAKEDQQWFGDNQKGFVEGFCPLCETRAYSRHLKPSKLMRDQDMPPYLKCERCGTLYLERHPSEAGYAEYYRQSRLMRMFSEHIFKDSLQNRKEHIYRPRLARMLDNLGKFGKKRGGYLEIGAGSGDFAKMARESGRFTQVSVVEPNPACANDCKALGLNVFENGVENVEAFPDDLICCGFFECIAHLADPAAVIKTYRKNCPKAVFW